MPGTDRPNSVDPNTVDSDSVDERTMLLSTLDFHRQLVRHRVANLTEEQSKERLVPSMTTPAGLVSHLASVERFWFVKVFDGQPWEPPWTKDDPNAAWRVDGRSLASITTDYDEAVAASNRIITGNDLSTSAADGSRIAAEVTLRWILVHMIAETAQHNGHLDILLEQLKDPASA